MDKATLVCVLKTGGEYTAEYVQRLHRSCMNNGGSDFVCLTDDQRVSRICQTIPLKDGYPGWWSKLEMFKLTKGKYVYIDLDTVINGDLTPLLTYHHRFTMLRDFNKKVTRPASGVMAWSGDYSHLHRGFNRSVIPKYDPKSGGSLGDQAFITDHLGFQPDYLQEIFPDMVSSYKWDTPDVKKKSTLVCYHGRPRPHQTGWKI